MGKVKRKPREPLPDDPHERALEKKRRNRESAQKLRNNKNSDITDMEHIINSLEREQARLLEVSRTEEAKQEYLKRFLVYFKGFSSSSSSSDSDSSPSSPASSSSFSAASPPYVPSSSSFPSSTSTSTSTSTTSSSTNSSSPATSMSMSTSMSPEMFQSISQMFPPQNQEQGSEALTTTKCFPGTTSALESFATSPASSPFTSTIASPLPKGVDVTFMMQVMWMLSFVPQHVVAAMAALAQSPAGMLATMSAAQAMTNGSWSTPSTPSLPVSSLQTGFPRISNIPTT